MSLLGIFLASFAIVFCLGFQSRTVNHGDYLMAAVTNVAISILNYYIIKNISTEHNMDAFVAYVAGGPLGITASIWAHKWYKKKYAHFHPVSA
jgi:hypothetical protein